MILRWGRKGLVAAAFAVTFVTPTPSTNSIHKADIRPSHKQIVRHITPAPSSTSSIHQADIQPSHKQIVRHITPSGALPAVPSIHRVNLLPGYKQIVRHITPAEEPVVVEDTGGGGSGKMAMLLREDQEILEIIAAIGPILTRMV